MREYSEGICSAHNCDKPLATGAGTVTYRLLEEAHLVPQPQYHHPACAAFTRLHFYDFNVGKVNGKYLWEQ